MAWKFVGDLIGLEPLPGIPLEAEDAEFDEAVDAYESQFGDEGKGSVKASKLYERVAKSELTQPPAEATDEGEEAN